MHWLEDFTYVGILARPVYVGLVLLGLALGLGRSGISPERQRRFFLAIAVPLLVWLAIAWYAAYVGAFVPAVPGRGSPVVPLAIFVPLIVWIAVLRRSKVMAAVLDAVPSSWLIGLQAYRVLGAAFLAQWAIGNASGAFAIPAGVGDVIVGLLAPLAAILVSRSGTNRWIGYGWNALGTLDLVSAVTLGILNGAGILPPPVNVLAPSLGAYPLVLVPAFTVPLSFVLHFLSVWQLRRRSANETTAVRPSLDHELVLQR
ncbi:hypothetical protein JQ594_10595 [Bradyrhizobium manausense]|uniref:hypothetical protein n=1 Tax=Bradyrhizobium manausense TaxID=989370 RepID=UPI001BA9EDA7|nr:hypothetical protein [Bradyrhizobium manausense]MBR0686364.1 hypothetical protein [Bradyrhizobium manausense]